MPRLAGFNPRLALIVFSGTGARNRSLARQVTTSWTRKRNSISPSNHVLFCLLGKHLTNKKLAYFKFQKESVLPFTHGAK